MTAVIALSKCSQTKKSLAFVLSVQVVTGITPGHFTFR